MFTPKGRKRVDFFYIGFRNPYQNKGVDDDVPF